MGVDAQCEREISAGAGHGGWSAHASGSRPMTTSRDLDGHGAAAVTRNDGRPTGVQKKRRIVARCRSGTQVGQASALMARGGGGPRRSLAVDPNEAGVPDSPVVARSADSAVSTGGSSASATTVSLPE